MAQNQKKVTAQDVLKWNGSDGGIQNLAQHLADVLNGDWDVNTAKQDILNYSKENSE